MMVKKLVLMAMFSGILSVTELYAAEDTFEFQRGQNRIKMTFQHEPNEQKIEGKVPQFSQTPSDKPANDDVLDAVKTIDQLFQYCMTRNVEFFYRVADGAYTKKDEFSVLYPVYTIDENFITGRQIIGSNFFKVVLPKDKITFAAAGQP